MPADFHGKVVVLDERVIQKPDAALSFEELLPRVLSVSRQRSRHGNAGDDDVGEPVPRCQPTHIASMVPFPPTPQYLPKASATLCPPNPNELLIAYLKSPYRGSPATTSRSISGSGVS